MSLSVTFVLDDGDTYRPFPQPFRGVDGNVYAVVHVNPQLENYAAIQGPPAQFRKLAAALITAAGDAEQWAEDHPAEVTP